jgi:hypothetical protein
LAAGVLLLADSALAWDPSGWKPPGLSHWVDIGPNLKASAQPKKGSSTNPYLSGPAVAVDRTNGDLYCLPIGDRLWKSTDQGQTFKCVYKDAPWGYTSTNAFTISPEGSKIGIFMGTSGYSLDGGTTFKYLGTVKPFQGGIVNWFEDSKRVLTFGAEGHFSINISQDGGSTFTDITTSDNMQEPSNMALLDGGVIMIQKGTPESGSFPLLRSEDTGKTWQKVPLPTMPTIAGWKGKSSIQFLIYPVRYKEKTYWVTNAGVYTTADAGKTWTLVGNPFTSDVNPPNYPLTGPYFGKDENQMVVVCKGRVMETVDRGKTWHILAYAPNDGMGYIEEQLFSSTAYDPVHDILYVGSHRHNAGPYIFSKLNLGRWGEKAEKAKTDPEKDDVKKAEIKKEEPKKEEIKDKK